MRSCPFSPGPFREKFHHACLTAKIPQHACDGDFLEIATLLKDDLHHSCYPLEFCDSHC